MVGIINKITKEYLRNSIIVLFTILFSANAAFATEEIDSFIVQTKESYLRARVDRILVNRGYRNYKKVNNNVLIVPRNNEKSVDEQIAEIRNTGLFETVEPNYKLILDKKNINDKAGNVVLNDRKANNHQYYLEQTNVPNVWNRANGNGVKVAILDSGVNANHPDLVGKVEGRAGHEYEDLNDAIGHGTEVAGIVTANGNNKKGIVGVAWNTRILSIKVTDENAEASVATLVEGLDKAYENGARIAVLSLSTNKVSTILKNSIAQAQDRGLLIIAAGGNSGINELRYPAAFDGVIGVGAVNRNNEIESYSTTGDIDIVAPGTDIYTTSINSKQYEYVTGTSFAAPQVAGVAALVLSIAPELTNNEVTEMLLNGANKNKSINLLNAQATVDLISD